MPTPGACCSRRAGRGVADGRRRAPDPAVAPCRSPGPVEKTVNTMQRDSQRPERSVPPGQSVPPEQSVPYVIVVGSEKGGTGKSTAAIHLAVALMKRGFRVGTIDLDARQGTFTAFCRNRAAAGERSGRAREKTKHRAIRAEEN